MEERTRFVLDVEGGLFSITELSDRYGISRNTAYRWLGRYKEAGLAGLEDRSRAPHSCPHLTPREIQELLIEVRRRHPLRGPKKLLAKLAEAHPDLELPAVSTAGDILKRAGLVQGRRRKHAHAAPPWQRRLTSASKPNDVWTVDFKGEFRLGNSHWCYPFTAADLYTRFLLRCDARPSTQTEGARASLQAAFREHGLPAVIRSDNGSPFGGTGVCGLSRLSVWLIKLGIQLERSERGHPEQNGAHERMHRTLKAHTARPPARHEVAQQRAFNAFRSEYNEDRPHEALGQRPPASLYKPSTRALPRRLSSPDYPGHFERRRVRDRGDIKWRNRKVFITTALITEDVGLEEVEDGVWAVYFGAVLLGRFGPGAKRLQTGT